MELSTYLQTLRERICDKDPGRLPGKPRGRIVFVFKEVEGTQRATIELQRTRVVVRDGAIDDESEPTAFVFGCLSDWLAFFEDADKARMSKLDFYGDLWLLKALPELAHQQLSPLAARLRQQIS
jgi:hypothetical protein